MIKNWRELNIGQLILFYAKDFDNFSCVKCTVTEKNAKYTTVTSNNGIKLEIDDSTAKFFYETLSIKEYCELIHINETGGVDETIACIKSRKTWCCNCIKRPNIWSEVVVVRDENNKNWYFIEHSEYSIYPNSDKKTIRQAVASNNLKAGTYRVGFYNDSNREDETEFDVYFLEDLVELYSDFCEENGFRKNTVRYVERVI